MTKIKFRMWDKITKEMTLNDSFYELQKWNRTEKELENFEIQQFTGLLDRNGKEIYEGDILKFGKEIHQVEFSNECVGFKPFNLFGTQFNYYEVIGNIYEHSNLLNN